MIVCKSPAEIERMRVANALVADVLAELAELVKPGVTTADLDAAAEKMVRAAGAEPDSGRLHKANKIVIWPVADRAAVSLCNAAAARRAR